MTRWFEAHTIARYGRYRQVEPTVVVEVAFDVIMRSTRHQSGSRSGSRGSRSLRPDKPADEIDTAGDRRAPLRGPPARCRAPCDGRRRRAGSATVDDARHAGAPGRCTVARCIAHRRRAARSTLVAVHGRATSSRATSAAPPPRDRHPERRRRGVHRPDRRLHGRTGARAATPTKADYAQVNLDSVLFAVADEPIEPSTPELRMVRSPERRSSPSRRSRSSARSTCCPSGTCATPWAS